MEDRKFAHEVNYVFVIHLLLVGMGVMFSKFLFTMNGAGGLWHATKHFILNALTRFDGGWYLGIAAHGYDEAVKTAFFPLYPTLASWLSVPFSWVLPEGNGLYSLPLIIAGLFISNVSFWLALWFVYKIGNRFMDRSTTVWGLLFLALFPTSFFFAAFYTESLFLCLVTAGLYFCYRKRWFTAAVLIGCAALTRNLGIFTVLPALLICFKSYGYSWRAAIKGWPVWVLLVVPAAMLGGYLLYLYSLYGDCLIFLKAMEHWSRTFAWPWESLITTLLHGSKKEFAVSFLFTLIALVSWRKLPLELWIYMTVGLLIPLTSIVVSPKGSSLSSTGRYVIVLFPAFFYIAQVLNGRWLKMMYLAGNVALLIYATGLFANWYWVG